MDFQRPLPVRMQMTKNQTHPDVASPKTNDIT